MRAGDYQLVILGLVLSAGLLSCRLALWFAVPSFLTLSATSIAFAAWVRTWLVRSRSILVIGGASLLATTPWFEFVLTPVDSPLRWLLAFALAWMMAPLAALALISLVERFSRCPPR